MAVITIFLIKGTCIKLPAPLFPGNLITRYKRFLADIKLDNGTTITAHCPDPGRMTGLLMPGSRVLCSKSDRPSRKLAFTWEFVRVGDTWVSVNTQRTNQLVYEALRDCRLPPFREYSEIQPEVMSSITKQTNSRIDFLLKPSAPSSGKLYLEIKTVSWVENRVARFPDAVTRRGQKHLQALMQIVDDGQQAALLFVIVRDDADRLIPADDIDPEYGRLLREASQKGVRLFAVACDIKPPEIQLSNPVEISLTPS